MMWFAHGRLWQSEEEAREARFQRPTDTRRMPPNATATPVTLGEWHRIEWYLKNATTTTSRDGVTRWWLDGILQGDYRDLQTPDNTGVIEYQLAPTWGGVVAV